MRRLAFGVFDHNLKDSASIPQTRVLRHTASALGREAIDAKEIEEAYDRVVAGDVPFRFVLISAQWRTALEEELPKTGHATD